MKHIRNTGKSPAMQGGEFLEKELLCPPGCEAATMPEILAVFNCNMPGKTKSQSK